jgi:ribonuclease P protein component
VVPRHQHTAVVRNKLKRRLRDIVRVELLPALRQRAPVDVAIRARHEAYKAPIEALRSDVQSIQAGITLDRGQLDPWPS